eukprot:scaffold56561_cov46-Phaeocystis_antarctica.AAC.2
MQSSPCYRTLNPKVPASYQRRVHLYPSVAEFKGTRTTRCNRCPFRPKQRQNLISPIAMLALLISPTALVAHSPLPTTRGAYAATPAMSTLSRANPAVMIVVPPAVQHGQSAALAQCTLELSSCASSGRAWRLWVARYS